MRGWGTIWERLKAKIAIARRISCAHFPKFVLNLSQIVRQFLTNSFFFLFPIVFFCFFSVFLLLSQCFSVSRPCVHVLYIKWVVTIIRNGHILLYFVNKFRCFSIHIYDLNIPDWVYDKWNFETHYNVYFAEFSQLWNI